MTMDNALRHFVEYFNISGFFRFSKVSMDRCHSVYKDGAQQSGTGCEAKLTSFLRAETRWSPG